MPDLPTLRLPAPWGAGVMLGLVRVWPVTHNLPMRGRVNVEQVKSVNYHAGERCLRESAMLLGKSLRHDFPQALLVDRALLGTVNVLDCVDIVAPGGRYGYTDHYYGGHERRYCLPWGLVLAQPVLSWSAAAAPEPAPHRRPAQAGLFAGGQL